MYNYGSPIASENCQQSRKAAQLNASTGGAGPLPIITTLLANPINVVDVTIDTIYVALSFKLDSNFII